MQLRLDAGNAEAWAALGAAGYEQVTRENALSRALSIDRQLAPAWAALGRLYLKAGAGQHASAALEQVEGI